MGKFLEKNNRETVSGKESKGGYIKGISRQRRISKKPVNHIKPIK
jgi:hypothetical protein